MNWPWTRPRRQPSLSDWREIGNAVVPTYPLVQAKLPCAGHLEEGRSYVILGAIGDTGHVLVADTAKLDGRLMPGWYHWNDFELVIDR